MNDIIKFYVENPILGAISILNGFFLIYWYSILVCKNWQKYINLFDIFVTVMLFIGSILPGSNLLTMCLSIVILFYYFGNLFKNYNFIIKDWRNKKSDF